MKLDRKYTLLGIALLCLLFLSSWQKSNVTKANKKLDKFICKEFNEQKLTKINVTIPDSLRMFSEDKLYKLLLKDSLVGYVMYSRANCCKVGGCSVYNRKDNKNPGYDPFYFATIYNMDLSIKKMNVLEYYGDYGYEITNKRWLKQFVAITGCNLNYGKEIDGITGATISVMSLIDVVKMNCGIIKILVK